MGGTFKINMCGEDKEASEKRENLVCEEVLGFSLYYGSL
jgi:hypothetical protein